MCTLSSAKSMPSESITNSTPLSLNPAHVRIDLGVRPRGPLHTSDLRRMSSTCDEQPGAAVEGGLRGQAWPMCEGGTW